MENSRTLIKHKITISGLVVLCFALLSFFVLRDRTGITLRNSDDIVIENANVSIDGEIAIYDSVAKIYSIAKEIIGFAMVVIKRPGYDDFNERIFFDSERSIVRLFLLRKGESYYYNYSKVPFKSGLNKILVYPSSDTLKSYLEELGLRYDERNVYLDEHRRESYQRHDTLFHPNFKKALVVMKNDSSNFLDSNCIEIKNMREFPNVLFAGTLISDQKELREMGVCFVLTNSFLIELVPDQTREDSLSHANYNILLRDLFAIGITKEQISDGGNNYILVTLENSIGYGIVDVMDKVRNCRAVKAMYSRRESLSLKPLPPKD